MIICGGMGAGEPSSHLDVWSIRFGASGPTHGGKETAPDGAAIVEPAVWPNPSRAEVNVSFALERQGEVRISVYDVTGRLVRVLKDSAMRAGLHTVSWDGRDGAGSKAAEGVYFCRIGAGGVTLTRAAVLLR
jgi:FlgD Ig-like domain